MQGRRVGATLLEVMVALTISGVTLAAAYGAMRAVVDGSARIENATAEVLRAAAIRRTIIGWIAAAELDADAGGTGFQGIDGVYQDMPDDEIRFVSGSAFPDGSTARIRLLIDRDDATEERGLVAEVAVPGTGDVATRIQLCPEVQGLDVEYVSQAFQRGDALPSWISRTVLPTGVVVHLLSANDSLPPLLKLPMRIALERWL